MVNNFRLEALGYRVCSLAIVSSDTCCFRIFRFDEIDKAWSKAVAPFQGVTTFLIPINQPLFRARREKVVWTHL